MLLSVKGEDIAEYSFRVPVEIAERPREDNGNIDRVRILEGEEETFTESSSGKRTYIFTQNFREIARDFGGV